MAIQFPTYFMLPPQMRRLGPTVERVRSRESNRYVLDLGPLGRMLRGSHTRCCRGRGVRCSAHLAEAIVEVGGEKQWEKGALCEHSDVKIFFGVCPHDTSYTFEARGRASEVWWRRRELNPGPKTFSTTDLHV